jgi:aspartate/methionine/tyrosine aminotransferase
MPRFSSTILDTAEPPIPAARRWAARYRGQHGEVLDLTQAVPGYPAHPELLARLGVAAADTACAGYGPIQGDLALREALAQDATEFYGHQISAPQVAITAGCNLAFAMAMKVIAAPGDEILIPVPWYFNHEMALRMAGVRAMPMPGLVPDLAAAEGLISPRTRAILLVSPNNPTGEIYSAPLLRDIADLCRKHGLWLVLDETYRDFLDAAPHGLFESHPDVLVHLYSFSKAYCLPGHRLGAVIAEETFQEQLAKALDALQICPARPAQAALAWAIPSLRGWRQQNRRIMAERAEACQTALARHRIEALGAYFAWLRLPDDAPHAVLAAEHLAAERGLLVLPGPFFGPGQERYLRLAFANAEAARLAELPERLDFSRA